MTDIAAVGEMLLKEAASAVSDTHKYIGDMSNPESQARLLAEVRELKWQLGNLYDDLERQLAATLEAKGMRCLDVEGLGRIERKRKLRRTGWDHDALLPKLVSWARSHRHFDAETAEVEGEGEAVARVFRETLNISGGKIRALDAIGILPEEYCTVVDDGYGIQLPLSDHGGRP